MRADLDHRRKRQTPTSTPVSLVGPSPPLRSPASVQPGSRFYRFATLVGMQTAVTAMTLTPEGGTERAGFFGPDGALFGYTHTPPADPLGGLLICSPLHGSSARTTAVRSFSPGVWLHAGSSSTGSITEAPATALGVPRNSPSTAWSRMRRSPWSSSKA